jgi:hypothetical protein
MVSTYKAATEVADRRRADGTYQDAETARSVEVADAR